MIISRYHVRTARTTSAHDDWPHEPFRSLALLVILLISIACWPG